MTLTTQFPNVYDSKRNLIVENYNFGLITFEAMMNELQALRTFFSEL